MASNNEASSQGEEEDNTDGKFILDCAAYLALIKRLATGDHKLTQRNALNLANG